MLGARHGTRCAGEVAAQANNSICSTGVAYEAGIGGKLLHTLCLRCWENLNNLHTSLSVTEVVKLFQRGRVSNFMECSDRRCTTDQCGIVFYSP